MRNNYILNRLIIVFLLGLTHFLADGSTYLWNGSVSSDWEDEDNWTLLYNDGDETNNYPDFIDDWAIIQNGANDPHILSSYNLFLAGLHIKSNYTGTFQILGRLTINENSISSGGVESEIDENICLFNSSENGNVRIKTNGIFRSFGYTPDAATYAIANLGDFVNEANGTIELYNDFEIGIDSYGGSFQNNGEIRLDNIPGAGIGLGGSTFTNGSSGEILFIGCLDGIHQYGDSNFENSGDLTFEGNMRDCVIVDYTGDFINKYNGTIFVESSERDGFRLEDNGSLINDGSIQLNSIGRHGIQLLGRGDLENKGDIVMNEITETGLVINGDFDVNSDNGEFINFSNALFSVEYANLGMDIDGNVVNWSVIDLEKLTFGIELYEDASMVNHTNGVIGANQDETGATMHIVLYMFDQTTFFNHGEILWEDVTGLAIRLMGDSEFENMDGGLIGHTDSGNLINTALLMGQSATYTNRANSMFAAFTPIILTETSSFINEADGIVQLATSLSSQITTNDGIIVRFHVGDITIQGPPGNGQILSSLGGDYMWVGTENNEWGSYSNWISKGKWKENSIPINDADATISIHTQNHNPIIDNFYVIAHRIWLEDDAILTIAENASLTLDAGNSLNVAISFNTDSKFYNYGILIIKNQTDAMRMIDGSVFINNGTTTINNISSYGILMQHNCFFVNNGELDLTDVGYGALYLLDNSDFTNHGNLSIIDADIGIHIFDSKFTNSDAGDITVDDITHVCIIMANPISTENDQFNNNGNLTLSNATEGINNKGYFNNNGIITAHDLVEVIDNAGRFTNTNQIIASENITEFGIILRYTNNGLYTEFINETNSAITTNSLQFLGGETYLINRGNIDLSGSMISTETNNNTSPGGIFGFGTFNIGGDLSLTNTSISNDPSTFNMNGGDNDILLADNLNYGFNNLNINSSDTISINQNFTIASQLQVNSGVFVLGPDLALVGDINHLLIAQNGILNASDVTINLSGDWENSGSLNAGTSSVIISGSANSEIRGSAPTIFNDLNIEKSNNAVVTVNQDFSTAEQLDLLAGELLISSTKTATVSSVQTESGKLTNNGTVDSEGNIWNGSGVIQGNGTFYCGGHWATISGTFIGSSAKMVMDGPTDAIIWDQNDPEINEFEVNKSSGGKVTVEHSFDVLNTGLIENGSLEIKSGKNIKFNHLTTAPSGTIQLIGSITLLGDMVNNGTFNSTANAYVNVAGVTEQFIEGNSSIQFGKLLVTKPSGTVHLNADAEISNLLKISSGILEVNGLVELQE